MNTRKALLYILAILVTLFVAWQLDESFGGMICSSLAIAFGIWIADLFSSKNRHESD